MTLQGKILTACLFSLAVPTLAVAQVVNEPVPGQPRQAQPGQPGAMNVAADEQQRQIQQAIAHAVGLAICGSELQLAAHALGNDRQTNQDADSNQNRRGREDDNAADNERNQRNRDNADNQNRREGDNENRTNAGRQSGRLGFRQAVQQLQQEAWKGFEESSQLFQAAAADLRNAEANRENRAGADREEASGRLHNIASQYANMLRSLSGGNERPSNAGSLGGQDDRDQAQNRNDNQNRDQRQGRNNLSRTEIAQIMLINHAVGEALDAYEHGQPAAPGRIGVQTTASQRILASSRQKSAESQKILQNLDATADGRNNNADTPNRNNQEIGDRNNDAQRGRQSQVSVQSLAQQARQLVDTLERSATNAQAPGAR